MRRPGGRTEEELVREVGAARRDPTLAVLEGFHAIKHGLRFGATPSRIVATDSASVDRLAAELAPDIAGRLKGRLEEVSPDLFRRLAPVRIATGVLALAPRARWVLEDALEAPGPIVLLEEPADLSNVGAVVRVAAAAGAAGILTLGSKDPWTAEALRSAAGLHYALPVLRIDTLPQTSRPFIAVDPEGVELGVGEPVPAGAILAFGTERGGLTSSLLECADYRVRIPMRSGVSSLNLATSVAAILYSGAVRR